MMRDLSGLTGDALDRAFLEDMVGHHMMAVMMSQHLLANGDSTHPEVAELAERISDEQRAEIRQMRRWLAAWFGQRTLGGHMYLTLRTQWRRRRSSLKATMTATTATAAATRSTRRSPSGVVVASAKRALACCTCRFAIAEGVALAVSSSRVRARRTRRSAMSASRAGMWSSTQSSLSPRSRRSLAT